ncbi:MAG: hypothetical protein Q9184_004523 [Pyrenodesmia sp. 2 TL-2023]
MSSMPLPPPQPSFVLRGHSVQVHAVHFIQGNSRLLTADADGWVVSWNLSYKRPVAAWKAHENAVLGIRSWGEDRIITHGRDSRLAVWQLGFEDEGALSRVLPVDNPPVTSPHPWLLHMLTVNTLNFCSFAMCLDGIPQPHGGHMAIKAQKQPPPILVAVPNTIDSGGIVAGYESGHTMVFVQSDPGAQFQRLYCAQSHSQPSPFQSSSYRQVSADLKLVLSLAVFPSRDCYVTAAADAIVAKHPLPAVQGIWKTDLKPFKVVQTKHSGQQGLHVRSDGKIFATAGWDGRVRVYSAKTMKEVAVLKWHKVGCYATAFAEMLDSESIETAVDAPTKDEDEEVGESDTTVAKPSTAVSIVQQRRDARAQSTHWLAVGSKDGKVSLWDIY